MLPCLGGPGIEWAAVLDDLGAISATYLWDRPGLGWSDSGRRPPTSSTHADELHCLLRAAEVPAPHVLVGHSSGGVIALLYAARYRAEGLAGVVLVDSSHPDMARRMADGVRSRRRTMLSAVQRLLTPAGYARAHAELRGRTPAVPRCWPAAYVEAGLAMARSSRMHRGTAYEALVFYPGLRTAQRAVRDLGDLPLLVLTSGEQGWPGWPQWVPLQRELARLSTDSSHEIASHVGHHMHRDDPAYVVAAIGEFVQQLRGADANG